jgi:uncharacterized membrane protein
MNSIDRRDELSQGLLGNGYDALSEVQKSVIDLMVSEEPTEMHPLAAADDRSFGERVSDSVAKVGGSWAFIFWFSGCLLAWVGLNTLLASFGKAFDAYPFIFLNLILSTVAALQAPVIMMSQNRHAAQDRRAAEHDYRVNLRAELEIMRLHDRLQLSEIQLQRIEAALAAITPDVPQITA